MFYTSKTNVLNVINEYKYNTFSKVHNDDFEKNIDNIDDK